MRGNNKRKLIEEKLLTTLLSKYKDGVPLTRLIGDYKLDVSPPHLRKLLFIYIDILNDEGVSAYRQQLRDAIFPAWNNNNVTIQPDSWTYAGRFPHGKWRIKHETI